MKKLVAVVDNLVAAWPKLTRSGGKVGGRGGQKISRSDQKN